jgi:hypothetical protein
MMSEQHFELPALRGDEYVYAIGYIESFLADLTKRKRRAAAVRESIELLPSMLSQAIERRRYALLSMARTPEDRR